LIASCSPISPGIKRGRNLFHSPPTYSCSSSGLGLSLPPTVLGILQCSVEKVSKRMYKEIEGIIRAAKSNCVYVYFLKYYFLKY
jgi:hypothetical protein